MKKKTERELYITPEEYKVFRKYSYAGHVKYGLLFDVACLGGLRISEALQIKVKDINYKDSSINIATLKRKNNPVYSIKYPKNIISALRMYIEGNYINLNNKVFDFTRQRAWQVFKYIMKKAKMNKRYSPHALRHCHATLCMEILKDKTLVSKRLRHSTDKHTTRYIHLTDNIQDAVVDGINKKL